MISSILSSHFLSYYNWYTKFKEGLTTKKILSLIMTFVIGMSLTACSGNTVDIEAAQELDLNIFLGEIEENILRAEEIYCNRPFKICGFVMAIEESYALIGNNNITFKVDLSSSELETLNKGEKITVAGDIDSINLAPSREILSVLPGTIEQDAISVEIKGSKFISDISEIYGTLRFYYMPLRDSNGNLTRQDGIEGAWYLALESYHGHYHLEDAIPVNHITGQKIECLKISDIDVKDGASVTLSGNIYDNVLRYSDGTTSYTGYPYTIENVELIQLN